MTDFVTVEGRTLANVMKFACVIIERRNTIPILNCVKLTFDTRTGRGLTISATNLDIEVRLICDDIDGAGDWSACISAATLRQIAQAAGVSPLRIERQEVEAHHPMDAKYTRIDLKITIGEGDAIYSIDDTSKVEDWPEIVGIRGDLIERFTNGQLADNLSKVAWAVSDEETRYYLNGVCWRAAEGGRALIATNGHMLAACRYGSDDNCLPERIIPRKTVAVICQFLRGHDVHIFANEKTTILDFVWPGGSMRAKMIDGTFPDVTRVIPNADNLNHAFKFRRDEIVTAIRQATAINAGNWRDSAAVRLHPVDGKMHVERRSVDIGAANIRTSVDWPSGLDRSFGFNAGYLIDIFGKCQGEISLAGGDPAAPFLISDSDDTMTRVLMPMRV